MKCNAQKEIGWKLAELRCFQDLKMPGQKELTLAQTNGKPNLSGSTGTLPIYTFTLLVNFHE